LWLFCPVTIRAFIGCLFAEAQFVVHRQPNSSAAMSANFVAVFKMGAFGAALATVIAQGFSVLISFFIIARKKLPFKFRKKYIRFDTFFVRIELKLGLPIALQDFLVGISFLVIQTAVNSLGLVASAGVGVAEKVCGFIMLIPSAIAQSLSAFVAQNIGAGQPLRAKQALKSGIAISLVMACFIGTFSFFRGDILTAIFSKDISVISSGHEYLKAYAIDVFLTSFLFCFIGYFNGNGKTLFSMAQGLIGGIAIRVPMVLLMRSLPDTNLFLIGLSTPIATFCQIILCFIYYIKTRNEKI
jgi:Na+-driven multidrug efflux pump